jgi:hypothetical protein
VKAALRKVGRVVREVLLFPFRLIWWILRGLGHSARVVGELVGDVVEAVLGGLFK